MGSPYVYVMLGEQSRIFNKRELIGKHVLKSRVTSTFYRASSTLLEFSAVSKSLLGFPLNWPELLLPSVTKSQNLLRLLN